MARGACARASAVSTQGERWAQCAHHDSVCREVGEEGNLQLLGLNGDGLGLVGEKLDQISEEGKHERLSRLAALLDDRPEATKGTSSSIRGFLVTVGNRLLKLGQYRALEPNL